MIAFTSFCRTNFRDGFYTQADTNQAMRQSLVLLSGIRDNTARISETNDLLKSVDKNLKIIASDPTRGLGGLPR